MRLVFYIVRCGVLGALLNAVTSSSATDYFLTIGGGYSPEANQASLEANVLFFQQVLIEKHSGSRTQAVYFADGMDNEPDLQVLRPRTKATTADASKSPATDLLSTLYSFSASQDVEYRNHRIPHVSGPNHPARIRASLDGMCAAMVSGDRLIVYVTAHGGIAKGRNSYNTTISCWDNQSISAREFERWLDGVPLGVPVVMIMAQCYCGGFAHTIFDNANREDGLSDRLRAGFYAQQHDLPAAGCRPDMENDEEYSSFFWGAFAGRSRTGKPMASADFDGNGRISFAEAHAHALLASDTIDIPIRASEALLRVYSRIGGYDHRRDAVDEVAASEPAAEGLASMAGSLRDISNLATPELKRTVAGLVSQLELQLEDDVPVVFVRFQEQLDRGRQLRRDAGRGRRGRGSARRELRDEIALKWPELAQRTAWRNADVLRESNQSQLMKQIELLPSYRQFTEYQEKRETTAAELEKEELREVKFQRLVNALEAILLAENLSKIASKSVVDRYNEMRAIEESYLD